MKKLFCLLMMIVPLVASVPVQAVTYTFPNHEASHMKNEAVLGVGSRVYLFQSGTEDVRRAISADDVLAVYRAYPSDFSRTAETGKVKVLCPLGDYYFEGEVIEGEAQPGNLAKKGTVACFVTSFKVIHRQ